MLRDLIVATVTALFVVAAHVLFLRFTGSENAAPDAPLRAALNQRITGEHAVRGSPRDGLAQLNSAGASMVVETTDDWPYVDRDDREPINLTLRDATLEQWLQAISFQLGSPYPCYSVDSEGEVHVSAPHRQRPPVATRVYDVRDLLNLEAEFSARFPRPNVYSPAESSVTAPWAVAEWGWGKILLDLGGGYTWVMKGGGSRSGAEVEVGDVNFRDGRLIVSHTPEVHRRISALLATLRVTANDSPVIEGAR